MAAATKITKERTANTKAAVNRDCETGVSPRSAVSHATTFAHLAFNTTQSGLSWETNLASHGLAFLRLVRDCAIPR
eukprot:1310381-Rhodomonas_salina.6